MRKLKKFSVFCVIFLLFSTFGLSTTAFAAYKPPFDLYSKGVYMVNLETNRVIVSENADEKLYPASVTKLMTMLVTLENVKNFKAKVECPYECYNEFWYSSDDDRYNPNYYNASNTAIEALQENVTYADCLYALMIRSGCEAANILAYNVAGSIEGFVAMMNETAERIGCRNTHFSNTHGLFDPNNYTTAYDVYLIARYTVEKYPGSLTYCSESEYFMPENEYNPNGYMLYTTNKLIDPDSDYYVSGVKGLKTGSIDEYFEKKNGVWDEENPKPGFCSLVTMCEKNGYSYIIVTLGAPYTDKNGEIAVSHFQDHVKLYEWAYSDFEIVDIVKKNQQVMKVDVEMGKGTDKVGVVTTEGFSTLVKKDLGVSAIQQIYPTVDTFTAPVNKGLSVGELELREGGNTLAVIPLVTEESIALDNIAKLQDKVKTVMLSPGVIASIIIMIVMIIAFAVSRTISTKIVAKNNEMARRRKIQMAPQSKGSKRR